MFIKYVVIFCLFSGFTLAENSSTKKQELNVSSLLVGTQTKPITVALPTPPTTSSTTSNPTTITNPSTTQSSSTPSPVPGPTISTTHTPSSSTPTPAPTPSPVEVWTVADAAKEITCIVAKMDIVMNVQYDGQPEELKASPKTVKAKGECGDSIQTLEIVLPQKNSSLTFSFNGTDKHYFISSLNMKIFLNATNKTVEDTEHLTLYETRRNTSYSCPSYESQFKPNKNTTIKISMSNIQIEAFRLTNSDKFSSAIHCPNGEVPDIVPLIVGLALAGLVIVVVIGYFIGRRRSQARGYLSM